MENVQMLTTYFYNNLELRSTQIGAINPLVRDNHFKKKQDELRNVADQVKSKGAVSNKLS